MIYLNMYELKNRKEIMLDVSKKIKTRRISLNYTQEEFSAKSGVTLSTYRTFEKSGKGSFENFIAILSALGSISELERLLPQTSFSPMAEFNKKKSSNTSILKGNLSEKKTLEKSPSLLEVIRAKNAKK